MLKPWKLATLFALLAIYPSWATGQYDRDQTSLGLAPETMNDSPLSPSMNADDAFSPETQGEESMATPAYAPETGEDAYPYADNPSASPAPAGFVDEHAPTPELQDNGDEALYSPSEAPSPADADVHAYAPVFPFNYSAEDDAGEFSYEEDENKINGSTIGLFVVGAVCVIGLGGLAYKKRREEKRKQYEMYQMARRGDFI